MVCTAVAIVREAGGTDVSKGIASATRKFASSSSLKRSRQVCLALAFHPFALLIQLCHSDDETAISDGDNIGCIELDIHLLRVVGPGPSSSQRNQTGGVIRETEVIHETAKKSGSHRVGFVDTCIYTLATFLILAAFSSVSATPL